MRDGLEVKKKHRMSKTKKMENFWGFLFILPNLVGFLVFTLFGVVFSFAMSLTDWNLLKGFDAANFVGFKNYIDMMSDPYFWASLRNNLLLLLMVPICMIVALVLAAILHKGVIWGAGARALYFLPYVTNVVAATTVWKALFHPTKGPINQLLIALGVSEEGLPGWLSSSKWFIPAVIIILVWQNVGYYVLMYAAGLQNISKDYYEAVEVDGGNAWHKFRYITVPLISPVSFMVMILGIISTFQMWSFVQILTPTGAGFGTASYTLSYYTYRSSFILFRSGYGAALSWVLCAIILVITLIQWRGQKKWVNY